jgi:6-phosphogluconate dehydrogenase (decarboxylating)
MELGMICRSLRDEFAGKLWCALRFQFGGHEGNADALKGGA